MDPHYQLLYQQSPGAILSVDSAGLIVDCNRAACAALARTSRELLSSPMLRWFLAPDRQRLKHAFHRALHGRTVEVRGHARRGDGSTRTFMLRAVPYGEPRDDAGLVERVDVFARDLGVRAPDGADALQALLLNLPGQYAVVLDDESRIRHASGLARTHWLNDDAVLGSEFAMLLEPGEENGRQMEALVRESRRGRTWTGTLMHRRADGVVFPARAYAACHRDPRTGAALGVLIVGQDASAERELRRKLALTERLSPVGRGVTSVARELVEPLRRLESQARTVLAGALATVPPAGAGPRRFDEAGLRALTAATELRVEAARVRRLLDGLLAFAGGATITRATTDVSAFVAAAVRAELQRTGAPDSTVEIVADDAGTAFVDADRLGVVIVELLRNAREATMGVPDGCVRVEAQVANGRVIVRVRDNGTGVAEAESQRIFEPFHTTRPGRLGLGLAVAAAVAAAHDGELRHEAALAGGSVFVVDVPADVTADAVAFRPAPLSIGARTILLIEEDGAVRRRFSEVLGRVGYKLVEALSGRSAIAHLTNGRRPDFIVIGLRMDGASGSWLLDHLARQFPDMLARTVIITTDERVQRGRVAEPTGCPVLAKPVDFSRLFEVLDELALRIGRMNRGPTG